MINFSELLWKPQAMVRGRKLSSASVNQASDSSVVDPDLMIPVDQVHIRPENRIALLTDSRGPGADRLRFIRMRLRELKETVKLRSLLITSPFPQDGKSTIALNLATALAEGGKRTVLLLEADLHRPSLAQGLGLQIRPGLAECLEDGSDPMSALRRLEPLGLYVLPAGQARRNPTELLQSDFLPAALQRLSPHFDWILVDTPPVAPLSDAVSLSRHVDTTMLVVRANRTPRAAVEEALALLGPKYVLGIIFNGAERLNPLYPEYYGHYGKK